MAVQIRDDEALLVTISAPGTTVRIRVVLERPSFGGDTVLAVDGDAHGRATLLPAQMVGIVRIVVHCSFKGPASGVFDILVSLAQSGSTVASHQFKLIVDALGEASGQVQFEVANPAPGIDLPSKWKFLAWDSARHTDQLYRVWYATTRRPVDPADPGRGFTGDRDDQVHYGACNVFIPKSHRIASIGSSWWRRLTSGQDDRLRLVDIQRYPVDLYWQLVAAQIEGGDTTERHALVFIHGFNVTFAEAAVRAAQIGCDLGIPEGAMAFFSWPSRGSIWPRSYQVDAASIEVSERAIADYLVDFARFSGATVVHVVAHSMGNRGILRAVANIAADAERRSGVRFGQFLLAAADVDSEKFRELCPAYCELGQRTTVYVSSSDLAVEASRWMHNYPRVGLAPPVTVVPGIDTVSVTNTDMTMLGHGYVANARDVLIDMHDLIRNNTPPSKRFALVLDKSEQYWHLTP